MAVGIIPEPMAAGEASLQHVLRLSEQTPIPFSFVALRPDGNLPPIDEVEHGGEERIPFLNLYYADRELLLSHPRTRETLAALAGTIVEQVRASLSSNAEVGRRN